VSRRLTRTNETDNRRTDYDTNCPKGKVIPVGNGDQCYRHTSNPVCALIHRDHLGTAALIYIKRAMIWVRAALAHGMAFCIDLCRLLAPWRTRAPPSKEDDPALLLQASLKETVSAIDWARTVAWK
jgi:hypothetical protein